MKHPSLSRASLQRYTPSNKKRKQDTHRHNPHRIYPVVGLYFFHDGNPYACRNVYNCQKHTNGHSFLTSSLYQHPPTCSSCYSLPSPLYWWYRPLPWPSTEERKNCMDKNEQRAHDLALLFVKQKIDQSHQDSDREFDEYSVFEMYKSAYDNFYDYLINP